MAGGRPDSGHATWEPSVLSAMSAEERRLVEAAGIKPGRVVARRPLTVVLERGWSLPVLVVGLIAFGLGLRQGVFAACLAGAAATAATCVSLLAHEAGHLLFASLARGVTPRLLLLRPSGGASVVEGRYADARGAALFAAGGPLATLAVLAAYALVALLVRGPIGAGIVVAAIVTAALLGLNLLPVAPMDGYLLFRAAIWASLHDREQAEERALGWSRCVLACALLAALLVYRTDASGGMLLLCLLATLVVQHHAVWLRREQLRRAGDAHGPLAGEP